MTTSIIKPWRILFLFLILLVFFASIFPIFDNDVWWHLKTGAYIFQHRSIPVTDIFSYTIYGKPWTAYEWLSEAALFAVYHYAGGLHGLTIFKALLAVLLFMVLLKNSKGNTVLTWLFLAVSYLAMRDGLRERPQMFSYLLVALYLYLFRQRKALWLVPLLQVVWVNMHGPTAAIGFGIAAIYALFADGIARRTRLYLIAATAAASFVNPHGYGIFAYALTFFREGFNRLILEYQPPVLNIVFVPYFCLLVSVLVSLVLPGKKRREENIILVIAAAASLMARRNIPIFAIIAAPLVADRFSAFLAERKWFPPLTHRLATLTGILFFLVFYSAGTALDVGKRYPFAIGDKHRSRFAGEFLRCVTALGLEYRLFNDYDFGGYLIWKLYPAGKVFVDGRLVEYGVPFVRDSFNYWKPEIWKKLDARYRFTVAVIPQENYYNAGYFDTLDDWVLVYWDDDALVYFRRVPQNMKYIRILGYQYIRPNAPNQSYLKTLPRGPVLNEINRSVYYAPQSSRARWMKKYLIKH